ncbi:DUF2111 domain-containing protein [Methanospirillum sp.]|uniref:DUF2111 domain-containing protein n=1 Tax=Methanospirillum sp. TaxID=45200 RepID=UPI00298448A2|nr:DUF2111 domain-containing protein [Methanospirillum sp.]
MNRYTISASSEPSDWIPISMAVHEMVGKLPVTARSLEKNGIRIEKGIVVDDDYSGPVLEEVLKTGEIRKITPSTGQYKGIPVIVSPLKDSTGAVFAAIGIVDITGIFDLATLMEHQSTIIKQVCGQDPCPLPTEQISAKR